MRRKQQYIMQQAESCNQTDRCVVGVTCLEHYSSYMKCTSKVVADEDPELGWCVKCKMLQVLEECKSKLTSQVMI